MIQLRHRQPSLCDAFWSEEVRGVWGPWMRVADGLLEDEALLDHVYDAQAKRHKHSRTRGRKQTPAEIVLRLLILKHARNWSYDVLEREVRANLAYRDFTRIGSQKVPDAKTLIRIGRVLGPEVIEQLHGRMVNLARERKVIQGRRLRVDTTVVESNIHYPTDSSLLADGARVLTRTMKRVGKAVGGIGWVPGCNRQQTAESNIQAGTSTTAPPSFPSELQTYTIVPRRFRSPLI